eukprot:NODE_44_length_33449_cov_1.575742.p37 type:complete len:106 gc:universal NODE_44_length_33449_cov_1.575742:10528-10211(-)
MVLSCIWKPNFMAYGILCIIGFLQVLQLVLPSSCCGNYFFCLQFGNCVLQIATGLKLTQIRFVSNHRFQTILSFLHPKVSCERDDFGGAFTKAPLKFQIKKMILM